MDAAVLHRLGCVGDLYQLTRGGIDIGERAGSDELQGIDLANRLGALFSSNSGRTSPPRWPHAVHTNKGSRSDSRTSALISTRRILQCCAARADPVRPQ